MIFPDLPALAQGHKIMNKLYDSTHTIREHKWSEKYKIELVKTKSVPVFLYTDFVESCVWLICNYLFDRNGRLQIDTPFFFL
jgi:hypothetical protein